MSGCQLSVNGLFVCTCSALLFMTFLLEAVGLRLSFHVVPWYNLKSTTAARYIETRLLGLFDSLKIDCNLSACLSSPSSIVPLLHGNNNKTGFRKYFYALEFREDNLLWFIYNLMHFSCLSSLIFCIFIIR